MKKLVMLLCIGLMSCMLAACGDDASYDEYEEENEEENEEEYEEDAVETEDAAETEDAEESSDVNAELADEIAKFDEVYAGAYGEDYEIVLAFDWTDEEQNGLVMIIPNGSTEMTYFNVGEMSGEIGEEQTITGLSEYPFTFTVSDYTEDGSSMELTFEEDGVCTVDMKDNDYLRNKCEEMGML